MAYNRPGVSRQYLHEAERPLGVHLLDRSTRPVKLTEAGRLYHEFCRDVLRRSTAS